MKNKDVAELYNPRMDANHKVLPLPSSKSPYISNVPEVRVHPIAAGDSFVIVACDGLWDELSNHEAVTRCANFLRLAKESERGGVAQHLVEYALDKAAQRLQRQEPELGVKNRQDLLKIPPGRDGRKYLHDDITVSVVVLGTPGSRYPGAAAARLTLFGSDLMVVPGLRQRRFPRPAKRQPWPSPGVGRAGGRSRRAST